MSSKQDLIEMQEVIKQCLALIKDLSTGWEGVVKSINKINSNKPSTYIATQKELKQSVDALNDSEVKLSKSMEQKEQVEKRLKATAQQLLTSGYNLNKQKEKELATEAKLQAQLEKSQNTYNRVQQKVNETTQAYNNLAAKKALGIDLNDKEQRTLALLEARLNKYQGVLKGVDANIGKYQRNVGNYASGWNGLSNSINQITREAPAFAVSLSTGFLALSNNIPILFDEIQRTREEVNTLRKAGEATESVFTKLSKSFFSWQTLISVGVTLLTIYGDEIITLISNFIKGSDSLNILKESQKQYNDAVKEGNKNAQQEVQELKVLIGVAKNTKASIDARKDAVQELQDKYPQYFANLTQEQIMNTDLTKITKELTGALMARAIAVASINKMTENASKILDLDEEYRLENKKLATLEKQAKVQAEITKNTLTTTAKENDIYTTTRLEDVTSRVLSSKQKLAETQKEINRLTAINQNLEQKAIEQQTKGSKAGVLNKPTESVNSTSKNPSVVSAEKAIDYTKDRIKAEFELQQAILNRQIQESQDESQIIGYKLMLTDNEYNHKKKLAELEIQDEETLKNTLLTLEEDYKTKILKLIGEEEKAYENSNKEIEKDLDLSLQERLRLQEEANKKQLELEQKLKDTLKSTAYGALGSLGGDSLAQFFNGEFEQMWDTAKTFEEKFALSMKAIGEIATQVFGQISEMQRANFEAELSRLEQSKEAALKFAGDSATGREAIEAQYEAKRKDLQKKQAITEKKMAILQIAMNTAVGITSALAMLPPNIPLSIAIGAIGALQAGIVASTPIPEFWVGTDNAPEGLALTQERGAEMITDKNGKIKTLGNSKGPQLTYLNKGDKVYNASDTTDKINEMLLGSGISPIVKVENNGLTEQQLRNALNDTLARQPRQTTKFDEKGVTLFIEKENSRTIKRGINARI